MEHPADELISRQTEEVRSVIYFLREFIPSQNERIDETYKYKTIFFYYRDKPFCYLNPDKRGLYIGFVHGYRMKPSKSLVAAGRSQIRSWHIDPDKDVNVIELTALLKEAMKIIDEDLKEHGAKTRVQ